MMLTCLELKKFINYTYVHQMLRSSTKKNSFSHQKDQNKQSQISLMHKPDLQQQSLHVCKTKVKNHLKIYFKAIKRAYSKKKECYKPHNFVMNFLKQNFTSKAFCKKSIAITQPKWKMIPNLILFLMPNSLCYLVGYPTLLAPFH